MVVHNFSNQKYRLQSEKHENRPRPNTHCHELIAAIASLHISELFTSLTLTLSGKVGEYIDPHAGSRDY